MRKIISLFILSFLLLMLSQSLLAGPPTNYEYKILLKYYDYNRDGILSNKELSEQLWYFYGRYDFNRDNLLTEKEFIDKKIPPARKK